MNPEDRLRLGLRRLSTGAGDTDLAWLPREAPKPRRLVRASTLVASAAAVTLALAGTAAVLNRSGGGSPSTLAQLLNSPSATARATMTTRPQASTSVKPAPKATPQTVTGHTAPSHANVIHLDLSPAEQTVTVGETVRIEVTARGDTDAVEVESPDWGDGVDRQQDNAQGCPVYAPGERPTPQPGGVHVTETATYSTPGDYTVVITARTTACDYDYYPGQATRTVSVHVTAA